MTRQITRRRLLRGTAASSLAFPFVITHRAGAASTGRELRVGGIGVGGKGWGDINETTKENARVVAISR